MAEIKDFGEKIGGAKKDLTRLRKNGGINIADIETWTDDERSQFITKNEVFPVPKYQELYDSGEYSKEALFFMKRVRDALSATPDMPLTAMKLSQDPTNEEYKQEAKNIQKSYIETVSHIKDILYSIKSSDDVINGCNTLVKYCNERIRNYKDRCFYTSRLNKAVSANSTWGMARLITEMKNKQFLFTDEEKILSKFNICQYRSGKITVEKDYRGEMYLGIRENYGTSYYYRLDKKYMNLDNWKDGTYFVTSDRQIVDFNFESYEQAKDFVLENNTVEKKKSTQTKRKTRLVPEQLQHIERTGEDYLDGIDVTGDMMMAQFGFRGGEFGNWESQDDRQANLNMSFEAFKDLAKALGVNDKDISLGGQLAIAYGARGSGAAVAHFESTGNVINLTKMSGAGSLAHEWGHALDHYIAKQTGKALRFESEAGRSAGIMKELMHTIKYNGNDYSKYYSDSQKMDKIYSKSDKGYWASNVELFARAFSVYVLDKLSPDRSDYLCGHAELKPFNYRDEVCYVHPVGEDRERINKAFDELIANLKEQELLHALPDAERMNSFKESIAQLAEDFNNIISEKNTDKIFDYLIDVAELIEKHDTNNQINTNILVSDATYINNHDSRCLESIREVVAKDFEDTLSAFVFLDIDSTKIKAALEQMGGSYEKETAVKPAHKAASYPTK